MPLQPLPSVRVCLVCAVAALPQPALFTQAPLPAQRGLPPPALRHAPLAVGDTVYVVPRFLNIRSRPYADGPGDPKLYVGHNRMGTVVAVPSRNWALVQFWSEDVGIVGYVSQWYLSEKKTERDY
jgi:hypothetical protein